MKVTNPYIKVLIAVLALFALWAITGAACDTDTEEALGVRVEEGKVQLTTSEGWTDANEFGGQAVEDALEDVQNIGQGVVDGVEAVTEQAQRYPSESNPTGGTCASPCDKKAMRKLCKQQNAKFDSCRCRCESK